MPEAKSEWNGDNTGMTDFLEVLAKVGSACGLVALPYVVLKSIRARPRFKFEFVGSDGQWQLDAQAHRMFKHSVRGTLKNRSLDPNAITQIHLVVWANKKKSAYLSDHIFTLSVSDAATKTDLRLPLQFAPKEAKSIEVVFEFPTENTADEKLLTDYIPVVEGSSTLRPRHKYELCFEDINENLFDPSGKRINKEEANLRWTLPNSIQQFQHGDMWPFVAHCGRILVSRIKFNTRLLIQALGLWR